MSSNVKVLKDKLIPIIENDPSLLTDSIDERRERLQIIFGNDTTIILDIIDLAIQQYKNKNQEDAITNKTLITALQVWNEGNDNEIPHEGFVGCSIKNNYILFNDQNISLDKSQYMRDNVWLTKLSGKNKFILYQGLLEQDVKYDFEGRDITSVALLPFFFADYLLITNDIFDKNYIYLLKGYNHKEFITKYNNWDDFYKKEYNRISNNENLLENERIDIIQKLEKYNQFFQKLNDKKTILNGNKSFDFFDLDQCVFNAFDENGKNITLGFSN